MLPSSMQKMMVEYELDFVYTMKRILTFQITNDSLMPVMKKILLLRLTNCLSNCAEIKNG